MNSFSKFAVLSLVILMFAPALKSRFEFSDALIYFIPFAIFFFAVIVLNVMISTFLLENLTVSIVYLLLFSPVLLAFVVGDAQETGLLFSFSVNCFLAVLVVLFPWNHRSVHLFFFLCALVGSVIAVNIVISYGSDVARELSADERDTGYITVSIAIGFACIASLYLVLSKPSPLSILLLATNWMGLVAGRGRGAVIFCVLVSAAYIILVLSNNRTAFSKSKKFVIIGIMLLLAPLVAYKMLSIEENRGRWTRLLEGFSDELEYGGRGPLMREALDKISQSPMVGNGLGEYMGFYGHPHNMFLQYGVDAGIIGVILLLGFLVKVASAGFAAISQHREDEFNMACVALGFFLYIVGNLMKSSDAYIGREFFISSALPIVMYQLCRYFRTDNRQ